jgi:DNA-binding SARP family transcriptional activator
MNTILHIRLLGDFRLRYGQTVITSLDSPRLQSLLTFLVLHRDAPQSRQQVAYLLWPDSSERQARANLRGLLLRLRRALPAAHTFIQADTHQVQWQPGVPFRLDVVDFERYLAEAAEAPGPASTPALQQAVTIYKGDILPGCYDDWIIPFRERLREAYVARLLRLGESAVAVAGDGTHLVVWRDGRNLNGDIYGQRLSIPGGLQGGNIAISNAAGDESRPVLAWSTTGDHYLVVW